ncbi:MAG: msrB, partial [Caulobacteraceae bacterium]|nr:msrB [Caulobacteraceae bacterium]
MTDVSAEHRSLSQSGFDLTPPTADQRAALEGALTQDQARVLLHHGTEAPFCGGLLDNKDAGVYACRLCGLPLFRSVTKFESGTGWPSFYAPFDEGHTKAVNDLSYGMVRTETRCA